MGISKYLRAAWKNPQENLGSLWQQRIIEWRNQTATFRVDHPTRLDRARSLGYKAKQGIIVVRQRVPKGGHNRPMPTTPGRKPKTRHQELTVGKNGRLIAEERAQKHYPNLEVLNSYPVGEDGLYKWFEVILVDTSHPAVQSDKDLSWITESQHTSRVFRGLTSAGKKVRGLRHKGMGAEKMRPSKAATFRRKQYPRYDIPPFKPQL